MRFNNLKLISTTVVSSAVFYSIVLIIGAYQGHSPLFLIRDVSQICNASSLIGIISTLGIIIWSLSSAICFFTIYYCQSFLIPITSLTYFGAFFSAILAADDLLMFHEKSSFEFVLFFFYAICALWLFFKTSELGRFYLNALFFSSFIFLGSSVLIDIAQGRLVTVVGYEFSQIIEEFLKFTGILLWLLSWCKHCARIISLRPVSRDQASFHQ